MPLTPSSRAAAAAVLVALLAISTATAQPGGGGGMGGMGGPGRGGDGPGNGAKRDSTCENPAQRESPAFFSVFARELRQRQPQLHLPPEVQAQFADFVSLVEEVGQHDERLTGRIAGKARSVSAALPVGTEIRARHAEIDDQQHALAELDQRWQSLSSALDDEGNTRVLDAFNAARVETQAMGKT